MYDFLRIISLLSSHPLSSIFPSVDRMHTDFNGCIFSVHCLFPGNLGITTGHDCIHSCAEKHKCVCAVGEKEWSKCMNCCVGWSPDGQTGLFLRGAFVFSLSLNHTYYIEHNIKGKWNWKSRWNWKSSASQLKCVDANNTPKISSSNIVSKFFMGQCLNGES